MMQVKFNEIPQPLYTEYEPFLVFPWKVVQKTQRVTIECSFKSKTRISTQIQAGLCRKVINFPVRGIRTYGERKISMYTYLPTIQDYFVISKKQGLKMYKKYITAVLRQLFTQHHVKIDTLQVDFINNCFKTK